MGQQPAGRFRRRRRTGKQHGDEEEDGETVTHGRGPRQPLGEGLSAFVREDQAKEDGHRDADARTDKDALYQTLAQGGFWAVGELARRVTVTRPAHMMKTNMAP